jgi:hypothetical protein
MAKNRNREHGKQSRGTAERDSHRGADTATMEKPEPRITAETGHKGRQRRFGHN